MIFMMIFVMIFFQLNCSPDLSSLEERRCCLRISRLSSLFRRRRCFMAKFPNGLPNTSCTCAGAVAAAAVKCARAPASSRFPLMTAVMMLPTTQNESERRANAPSRSPSLLCLSFVAFIPPIRIASISHGAANFPHRASIGGRRNRRSSRELAANGILRRAPRKFAPCI